MCRMNTRSFWGDCDKGDRSFGVMHVFKLNAMTAGAGRCSCHVMGVRSGVE